MLGSYSTLSTRLPWRSWVWRTGRLVCARRACSSASDEATTAPKSRTRSTPHAPPSRSSASTSAGSVSKALWPSSGGDWLRTSCVESAARGVTAMAGLLLRVESPAAMDGGEAELDQRGDQRLVTAEPAGSGGRERADQRLADRADQAGGHRLDILLGQLAGVDPLAQQPRQDIAVAAPQRQALGLDRGIDRLGDLRVGEHRPRQRTARERLHARGHALGDRPVALGGQVAQHLELAVGR